MSARWHVKMYGPDGDLRLHTWHTTEASYQMEVEVAQESGRYLLIELIDLKGATIEKFYPTK